MARRGDADLRRRSALRVLVPPLVLVLVVLAAMTVRASSGDAQSAALVLSGGVGLIALWAVLDGLGRAFGRATYLGTGRGLDRLLGLIQVFASVGLALALLPNAVALLNLLARMASDQVRSP
jgi:hypothetical protein